MSHGSSNITADHPAACTLPHLEYRDSTQIKMPRHYGYSLSGANDGGTVDAQSPATFAFFSHVSGTYVNLSHASSVIPMRPPHLQLQVRRSLAFSGPSGSGTKRRQYLRIGRIPDTYGAIFAARGDGCSICRRSCSIDIIRVAWEFSCRIAVGRGVEKHPFVAAAAEHHIL